MTLTANHVHFGRFACQSDGVVIATESMDSGSVRDSLTPPVVRFLVGVAGTAVGGGLTLSLLIVYLHQVRGLSLAISGLVLSYVALLGFLIAPLVGPLVDRYGPRRVLLAGVFVEATGVACYSLVHTAPQAFAVATATGIGGAALWAPQSALVASLVPAEQRQRIYGLQFALLNLGVGIGGVIGSLIIDVARPETFTTLYLVDGASYGVYLIALLTLRRYGGPVPMPEPAPGADADAPKGYGVVFADRAMRRLVVASFLLLTCGYGSIEAGVASYITIVAKLPANVIGIVFAVNTAVIVVAQIPLLHWIEGRSRSGLMRWVGLAWGACWLLAAGMAVFALGETLWSPVQPALLNELAPPHLRGRYNAVSSVAWNVSGAIGPAFAGVMIGSGLGGLWALVVAGGCVAAGALLARMRTLLTPAQDGRMAGVPGVVGGGRIQV